MDREIVETFAYLRCRKTRNISKRFSFAHACAVFVITESFILTTYHKVFFMSTIRANSRISIKKVIHSFVFFSIKNIDRVDDIRDN